MSSNTHAVLRKDTTINDIVEILSKKQKNVKVNSTSIHYMYTIDFETSTDEKRRMFVFTDAELTKSDYGIYGILCHLGYWGESVEILQNLCEHFGGYLDKNDCDDEGFIPINQELFNQVVDQDPMSLVENKILSEFGHEKMKKVLSLFQEYHQIMLNKVT